VQASPRMNSGVSALTVLIFSLAQELGLVFKHQTIQ
jgi:hypothetical protein